MGPWLPEPILSTDHPELTSASEYDAVSLAFLVLLERLTPAERAVLVLREVFDYEYDEIAVMLDKSDAACRKLVSRAKDGIAANRPRFPVSPEDHSRLLEEFMSAARGGDLDGLKTTRGRRNLLGRWWRQGARGGPATGARSRRCGAVRHRRHGAVTPAGGHIAVADVNGKPALVIRHPDGTPAIVVSIAVDQARIHNIWAIANPDKLKGV